MKYGLLILCFEHVCPVNEFSSSSSCEPFQPCGNQSILSSDANMSIVKRYKGGDISMRYVICSRSGFSKGIRNKGTRKRLISNRDKSIAASKKRKRDCTLCHKSYHDARTCHLRNKDK